MNLNEFTDLRNLNQLETFFNLLKNFDSFEDFVKFMMIMKNIPTLQQIDNLTKSNKNLKIFESLQSQGYFKLLSPIQKYHLFVSACSHNSIDIAMLIFNNNVDLEGVKELMLNYFIQICSNTEYIIFRKIWEKNIISFNTEEIEEIFFSILKCSNLEFVEWFCSLNLININDNRIQNKIASDVLANANNYDDYMIAKFICSLYIQKKIH
jgi:hypothetical protein